MGGYGGVQICCGRVWRSPDLFWAGVEESRFVLGRYGGVQICCGLVWRSLDLFWASMEESRFVLGRYGGVQICSGPVWRSLDLFWAGMEESRFVLGRYGGVQISTWSLYQRLTYLTMVQEQFSHRWMRMERSIQMHISLANFFLESEVLSSRKGVPCKQAWCQGISECTYQDTFLQYREIIVLWNG